MTSSPALTAATTVGAAFQRIGITCLADLSSAADGLKATGDPEAIHQMRVALRRLRAAARFFERRKPSDHALDGLLAELAAARDDGVLLAAVEAVEGEIDGAGLATVWRERARTSQDILCQTVHGPRFGVVLDAADAWVRASVTASDSLLLLDFGCAGLTHCDRRIRRVGGGRFRDVAPSDWHPLRIKTKHLRYGGDILAPLFPGKAAQRYRKAVASLQDRLGALTDGLVAAQMLAATPGPAADRFLALQNATRHERIAAAAHAWKRFWTSEPYWCAQKK